MPALEWIKQNLPACGLVLLMIVLVFGVKWLKIGKEDYSRYTYGYFYNTETKTLFVDKKASPPPILDGKGVSATVFTCGSCEDKSSHFTGWLQKYTDKAKDALLKQLNAPMASPEEAQNPMSENMALREIIANGDMIAAVPDSTGGDPQWVYANSPEAQIIRDEANAKCRKTLKLCSPLQNEIPN